MAKPQPISHKNFAESFITSIAAFHIESNIFFTSLSTFISLFINFFVIFQSHPQISSASPYHTMRLKVKFSFCIGESFETSVSQPVIKNIEYTFLRVKSDFFTSTDDHMRFQD